MIRLSSTGEDENSGDAEHQMVPLEVFLTFPMFLRIYLFCRLLTLHRYSTCISCQHLHKMGLIGIPYQTMNNVDPFCLMGNLYGKLYLIADHLKCVRGQDDVW